MKFTAKLLCCSVLIVGALGAYQQADEETIFEWPEGVVHFKIDDSLTQTGWLMCILNAVHIISTQTNVLWKEIHDGDELPEHYVTFKGHPNRCCSDVGMVKAKQEQEIKLAADGFDKTHVYVMHEMIHALGFHHEHQRSDRDKYIKIHRENIKENPLRSAEELTLIYDLDYAIVPNCHNEHGDYDPFSIMHYPAFSGGATKPIITWAESKVKGMKEQELVPKHEFANNKLSPGDISMINHLYPEPQTLWINEYEEEQWIVQFEQLSTRLQTYPEYLRKRTMEMTPEKIMDMYDNEIEENKKFGAIMKFQEQMFKTENGSLFMAIVSCQFRLLKIREFIYKAYIDLCRKTRRQSMRSRIIGSESDYRHHIRELERKLLDTRHKMANPLNTIKKYTEMQDRAQERAGKPKKKKMCTIC